VARRPLFCRFENILMHAILGKKIDQTQKFLTDGQRVPVTKVEVEPNPVILIRNMDRDGYIAVQLGYGKQQKASKSTAGHSKKGAKLEHAPIFLREIRFADSTKIEDLPKAGEIINVDAVLEPGDIVDIIGVSKGKGFAGFVKRHHFKGGPKTHGQSDRQRAPGAVSSGTTPGRIRKGKRMAGRMGHSKVTVKNLQVVSIMPNAVLIKGLVPGVRGLFIKIRKTGKKVKNFVDMVKEEK